MTDRDAPAGGPQASGSRRRVAWRLLVDTFTEWNRDNVSSLAASLAFYAVLSLAPASVVVIALLGLLLGEQAAQSQLVEQVRTFVGEDGAAALQAVIDQGSPHGAGIAATIVGAVTLVVAVSGFFAELQDSLSFIWRAERRRARGFLRQLADRLLSFTMVFGVGILLLASMAASAGVAALAGQLGLTDGWLEVTRHATSFTFSCVVTFLLFSVFHKVLPDAEVEWRNVWVGAAATAVLFSIGRLLIGLYLGWSSVASAYGAAGSILALLLWVYYSAQILFFGAEFTKVWGRHRGRDLRPAQTDSTAGSE